jgi:hypothetical protein
MKLISPLIALLAFLSAAENVKSEEERPVYGVDVVCPIKDKIQNLLE